MDYPAYAPRYKLCAVLRKAPNTKIYLYNLNFPPIYAINRKIFPKDLECTENAYLKMYIGSKAKCMRR